MSFLVLKRREAGKAHHGSEFGISQGISQGYLWCKATYKNWLVETGGTGDLKVSLC